VKPIRTRPQADDDIDRATAFLLQESPAAAVGLLDALEHDFATLARQPGVGSQRYAHLIPGQTLRMWPVSGYPWLIFYFEYPDHLEVIRVLHSRRDMPAALGE